MVPRRSTCRTSWFDVDARSWSLPGVASKLFAGLAGVTLAIGLAVELPCEDCGGYPTSILSILLLAALFCLPAVLWEREKKRTLRPSGVIQRKVPAIITTLTIGVTITLLLSLIFTGSYQMSVVNSFSGVANSHFSDLEVGRTFVSIQLAIYPYRESHPNPWE